MNNQVSVPGFDPAGARIPSARDEIAARVAAALILKEVEWTALSGRVIGRQAYEFADEMLKAREELADRRR